MVFGAVRAYLQRCTTIRVRAGAMGNLAAAVLCILLAFSAWHLFTLGAPEERIIDPITLPSLHETLGSFPRLWFDRALARSALWSLGRVLGGFVLAASIAVPLGAMAGAFPRLHAFLKPLSIFGRNVPIAALIPLTLIWFGLGETQKVMFIFLASVAFVFFDSVCAVNAVPDSYLDASYTLGAEYRGKRGAKLAALAGLLYSGVFLGAYLLLTRRPSVEEAELRAAWNLHAAILGGTGFAAGFLLWFPILSFQAIQKVLLPLAMPDIVNSLRLLFGLAFGYIMLAEVINAEFGLGAIINLSQRQGPREHIYLALILIALLAFAIDRGILSLQRRLFPYRAMGES